MFDELSVVCFLFFLPLVFFGHWVWDRIFSRQGIPADIPWAGAQDQHLLSRARANLRSLFGLKELIQDGYYKYSKNERLFVLPNLATGHEVMLPMSQLKWLLSKRDKILDQTAVNREFLHADRTMLHVKVIVDKVHGRVINREMSKDLDNYADAIVEEIEHSLARNWGVGPEWKEVPVYSTMLDVIARITNRVLVGLPLCRDEEYLKSASTFARFVVIEAGLLNLLPTYLQFIFSPLILAYSRYHYRKIAERILPIVKERARRYKPGMDYKTPDYSKHNDYVEWALHDAYSHDDPLERTPEMITKRLAVLSFAGIQSSVITITNALFDIAASPRCLEFQEILRDEVIQVANDHPDNLWKRTGLAAMAKIDSTFRESMRLWGFITRGVLKKVMPKEGITLPSGHHLPQGTNVGVTQHAVHHDNDIYPDAATFDALRFAETMDEEGLYSTVNTGDKRANMVTSSDRFMGFSHGRHACPGRFFAANQLKLLLAQIVTKYDIEPIAVRPPNPWLNNTIGPPVNETFRIRRRDAVPPASVPVPIDSAMPSPVEDKSMSAGFSSAIFDRKMLDSFADGLCGPGPALVEAV